MNTTELMSYMLVSSEPINIYYRKDTRKIGRFKHAFPSDNLILLFNRQRKMTTRLVAVEFKKDQFRLCKVVETFIPLDSLIVEVIE